jgi:putative ABC transport system substrate-binding protein
MTASWLVLAVTLTIGLLAEPFAAEAQVSGRVPRVGYLGFERWTTPEPFEQALKDLGWEDGRNVALEMRFTLDAARIPALAAELVRLNCDVIVAPDEVRVNALRQATQTIPIVFWAVGDPVAVGYAASLRRPGGMLTGLSSQWYEWTGKRMEILKETISRAQPVAVLTNPPEASPALAAGLKDLEGVSRSLRLSYKTYLATEAGDVDRAIARMTRDGARSLVMLSSSGLFWVERKRIADLALRHRLPTMCEGRDWVQAGCLMSYSPNLDDLYRRSATYVDKILKGAKPADLPIQQPTKFEFVINLTTAKALGLTIPPSVLARADQLIQ